MSEKLSIISGILMIALILLQFVVLIHLMYTRHKEYKHEKKFWAEQEKQSKELYEKLRTQSIEALKNRALSDEENKQ